MSAQQPEGFDPNSEQARNGECKGAEKDFSTQLQERLQTLAERNPKTEFMTGFGTQFEGDNVGFEVHVQQRPATDFQLIDFSMGGVKGTLRIQSGYVQDILSSTYGDPEAHLVDWRKMADDEEAPQAIRLIAGRMHQFVHGKESPEPIDRAGIMAMTQAIWDTAREINAPILYSTSNTYETPEGRVSVDGFSDISNMEGEYLPDETKLGQMIFVGGPGFHYTRELRGGAVSEYFAEDISLDTLPSLTDEERKKHPYVVIPAEQGRPRQDDEHMAFDQDGNPAELSYPGTGFTVISANVGNGMTIRFQTWHKTREEAQAEADRRYACDLALERSNPYDMTSARQKQVLDALDVALLATELEVPGDLKL